MRAVLPFLIVLLFAAPASAAPPWSDPVRRGDGPVRRAVRAALAPVLRHGLAARVVRRLARGGDGGERATGCSSRSAARMGSTAPRSGSPRARSAASSSRPMRTGTSRSRGSRTRGKQRPRVHRVPPRGQVVHAADPAGHRPAALGLDRRLPARRPAARLRRPGRGQDALQAHGRAALRPRPGTRIGADAERAAAHRGHRQRPRVRRLGRSGLLPGGRADGRFWPLPRRAAARVGARTRWARSRRRRHQPRHRGLGHDHRARRDHRRERDVRRRAGHRAGRRGRTGERTRRPPRRRLDERRPAVSRRSRPPRGPFGAPEPVSPATGPVTAAFDATGNRFWLVWNNQTAAYRSA